jgi:hypothetical protein
MRHIVRRLDLQAQSPLSSGCLTIAEEIAAGIGADCMGDSVMTTVNNGGLAPQTALGRAQLDGLLTGNTAYIELPPGGPGGPNWGIAFAYYGDDGRASFKLPTGTILRGAWSLKDDRYCADWDNGPKSSCTKVIRMPGAVLVIDAATGERRGSIAKIVPGNAEQL